MPSTEPEQNVLSSQSSMNLCESLSIRLFAVEQGLPSGNVPDRTGITSEPERYTYTRIRTWDDRSGEALDIMNSVLDDCGAMNGGNESGSR